MSHPIVDAMPLATLLGVKILSAEKEKVVGQIIVRPELCTTNKILHGGSIMAFADTLGAAAAFLNLPQGALGTTTIESKTNFLNAAPIGQTITATCVPIKVGSRLSVWSTELVREDGKPVALVSQTQLVLR
tara:strand:- start:32441 stop:32833 length:393 start_codon:yes stop_codon:yes gene_type:complete